jgi:hypothetical protein
VAGSTIRSRVSRSTLERAAEAAEFEPEAAATLSDDDRLAERGDANIPHSGERTARRASLLRQLLAISAAWSSGEL